MLSLLSRLFAPARPAQAFAWLFGLALAAMLLLLLPTMAVMAQAATCTGSAITGAVYRDYNATGLRDPYEPGIAGIVVTAYDATGSTSSCVTSGAGTYGIDPAGAYPVRLEFTLPADGSLAFLRPGAAGSGSRTTVTFVNAPINGVDVGFNNPADFCGRTSAPTLAVSCFAFGEQNDNPAGVNKEQAVLHTFPYTAGSSQTTNSAAVRTPPPTAIAAAKQLGSVWGLTWSPITQKLYAAAFLKRHAGFGPNGPGAIYQITPSGAVSLFYDLGALVGPDPHPRPDQTCTTSPQRNQRNDNGNCWLHDSNAFDAVGKMGLGDLDIAEDFKTIYTVNLYDNTLVALPVSNPANFTAAPIPAPANCPAADQRPFGLGVQDGKVYVGMVCSAESTSNRNDLRAYVFRYANGSFSPTPVLAFALNYNRGGSNVLWQPWLNKTTFNPTISLQRDGKWGQPWLTDIAFDNGDMILGLRDRNGDLFGVIAGGPDSNDTRNYTVVSRGDILRACANGSDAWVIESNGQCGVIRTTGTGNTQGPGGGEYYFQDQHPKHNETSTGAQIQIPGMPEVASLANNPIELASEVSDGGVKWFDNRTGTTKRSYLILDGSDEVTLFDKANGLGDFEPMCAAAPTEIGNRVWHDANGNGVQDPQEAGIDSVQVELYRNGLLVGATTTANGGEYLFTDSNVTLNGAAGLVTGTCGANGLSEYEVRIPNITGGNQQAALVGLVLTVANHGGATNGELRDSNGLSIGVDAVYAIPCTHLTTPGDNNHTYDFGFTAILVTVTPTPTPTPTVTPTPTPLPVYSLGNYVWFDKNENGQVDAGELPVPNGVVVELLDGAGNPTGKTTTTANGFYLFSQLSAGNYRVRLAASNFQSGALLEKYVSTSGAAAEADPNRNGDQNDNGLNDTEPPSAGIPSAVVTLGNGEPIGETPTATGNAGDDGQQTPDAQSNLTVDLGVILSRVEAQSQLVAIGNLVFLDPNNNGRFEPGEGERGVRGATLQLFRSGTPTAISTTVTSAEGFYLFDNLPAGQYAVCVTPGNFATKSVLEGYRSSSGAGSDATTDQDGDENGNDGTSPTQQGVCSQVLDLQPDRARTGENQTNYNGPWDDDNVNFTLDFGFVLLPTGLEPEDEPQAANRQMSFLPIVVKK